MRSFLLHSKLALRSMGWVPAAVFLGFGLCASIQEPAFFRTQGLDLLWPSCAVSADIMTLSAFTAWLVAAGHVYGSTNVCGAAAALLGTALLLALGAALACSLLDLAHGGPIELWRAGTLLARALLVWAPLALLAVGLAVPWGNRGWPVAGLFAAFLVQLAAHPVSMASPGVAVGNVLASTVALAGSAALALAMRSRRQARAT